MLAIWTTLFNLRDRLNPKLKAAGWNVVSANSLSSTTGDRLAVKEFETPIGPEDYALIDGGRYLRVAKAKMLTLALNEMLTRDLDAKLARLSEIPINHRIRPHQQGTG